MTRQPPSAQDLSLGLSSKEISEVDLIDIMEQSPLSLEFVSPQRESVIDAALRANGCAIEFVENPSIQHYQLAIETSPQAIGLIPVDVLDDMRAMGYDV